MRQTLKIGVVTLAVAAMAMSGIALAQTDDPAGDAHVAAPDDTAAPEDRAAGRVLDLLEPLVEDGTITETQAEAVAETLGEGFGHRRGGRHGFGLEAAAEFLGISVDDVRAALESGATLADVAAENGSSAGDLVDELAAAAGERLDQAIADGRLDESEKAERLAEITERITAMVNGDLPLDGHRGRGHCHPEGGETADA
jgi:uncharacterized protein YidB (DUF937 family)